MKILYGVQATGNGHISRAHAMAKYLNPANTDYLFSGRARADFFAMDKFGDWQCQSGLTFSHRNGSIDNLSTLKNNQWWQFIKDVQATREKLDDYDLVLSDFEPITAWAAKLSGKTCIGLGHQYAFEHPFPHSGSNIISRNIMRHFAPATLGLGLHWHHFNQAILPPIIDFSHQQQAEVGDDAPILVYLGFESQDHVSQLLKPFKQQQFIVYGPFTPGPVETHIIYKSASREGFMQDLANSQGVICNAGFELASEAISLGKKILVKPLQGQMEQQSNAKALQALDLGSVMQTLCATTLEQWLKQMPATKIFYPDVAKHISNWIYQGQWQHSKSLLRELWSQTRAENNPYFGSIPAL